MNPLQAFSSALPYRLDALEPVLSRETVQYHLIQHHRQCYERTAALVRGTPLESLSLESLVRATASLPRSRQLFALAAEAWNHDLYWRSLRPGAGGEARGPIADLIRSSFNSFEGFMRRVQGVAGELLGSGWLWVTWRRGTLEVLTTELADSPVTRGHVPLLAVDLWEHAYYLDYYNARGAYVAACLRQLIDWERANERLLQLGTERVRGAQTLAWLARSNPAVRSVAHERDLLPEGSTKESRVCL